MVNISQYVPQVSSQSIGLQESGGNGYIGNQALSQLGQVVGGNIDKSLSIDEQSIANKEQANIASANLVYKRQQETEQALAKQQDFKIKTGIHGAVIDSTFSIKTKLQDLKNEIGAGANGYFEKSRKLIDDEYEKSIGNLQGENRLFAEQIVQKQKY
ncbi:MAG: hypothetical protein EBU90_24405, partial [Proteobacteria bacterium]|nr:hypothetical protein [Pseudomonadota bacterium]